MDLKDLITKNKMFFDDVFRPWQYYMSMFDILSNYRNALFHREEDVLLHQHHLCLGICGELLLAISHWEKGYSRKIISYECDIQFDEPEGNQPGLAEEGSANAAKQWANELISSSLNPDYISPYTNQPSIQDQLT